MNRAGASGSPAAEQRKGKRATAGGVAIRWRDSARAGDSSHCEAAACQARVKRQARAAAATDVEQGSRLLTGATVPTEPPSSSLFFL